jgi:hypothetical protein
MLGAWLLFHYYPGSNIEQPSLLIIGVLLLPPE